jgi:hypothetical protein
MASAVYNNFKDELGQGNVDLLTADLRLAVIDSADYTFSQTHDFLDDVAVGSIVAVSGSITGKTLVDGLLDGTVPTITGVTGDPVEACILYVHDGGADRARLLIAFIDTESDGSTPISFTPNGSDLDVTTPNGLLQL